MTAPTPPAVCVECGRRFHAGELVDPWAGSVAHKWCVVGKTRECLMCPARVTYTEHGLWVHPSPNGTIYCVAPDVPASHQPAEPLLAYHPQDGRPERYEL